MALKNKRHKLVTRYEKYSKHSAKDIYRKKYYAIYKDIVGGFLGNYKLLEETLTKVETTTVLLSEFQIKGFDQNAFYGAHRDEAQNVWYLVKDYAFRIFCKPTDKKTYLTIKRL